MRVSFELDPAGTELSELRLALRLADQPDLRDVALSMDKSMSELTVAGRRIGRIPDASSPELLPSEAPLEMPDQDFAKRGACAAPRTPRLLDPARRAVRGHVHFDRGLRLRALRRAGAWSSSRRSSSCSSCLSTIAFGWIALGSLERGLGLPAAVLRREGRHHRVAAARRRAHHAHGTSVPRLSRGAGAGRRHGAGDRARAAVDGPRSRLRRLHPVRYAR